jgi:hypothetical protein
MEVLMPATFLLPESIARENGSGPEIDLGAARCKQLQLTLGINRILDQQSLEISVLGSPDGKSWRRLERFPQKFYCGTYARTLDLSRHPDVRFLRAEWIMGRWGARNEDAGPLFGFYLMVEELKMAVVGA